MKTTTAACLVAGLLVVCGPSERALAQYRGGSDPGRANFSTGVDPRRLPGPPPYRNIPTQAAADPMRIYTPQPHLRRFPPPPSQPAFPPVFTLSPAGLLFPGSFPQGGSRRDSYYAPNLVRDQAGQAALRTRANRVQDRLNFQK